MDAWFAPYTDQGLHLASWGFAVEAGTHALRLIYSGLFDRHPGLQMILGHLGEMLPFTAFRTDRYYGLGGSGGTLAKLPSAYLRENFFVTTSGNFSPPAMACTLAVLGADRVMFSVDYPMDDNQAGAEFLALILIVVYVGAVARRSPVRGSASRSLPAMPSRVSRWANSGSAQRVRRPLRRRPHRPARPTCVIAPGIPAETCGCSRCRPG